MKITINHYPEEMQLLQKRMDWLSKSNVVRIAFISQVLSSGGDAHLMPFAFYQTKNDYGRLNKYKRELFYESLLYSNKKLGKTTIVLKEPELALIRRIGNSKVPQMSMKGVIEDAVMWSAVAIFDDLYSQKDYRNIVHEILSKHGTFDLCEDYAFLLPLVKRDLLQ